MGQEARPPLEMFCSVPGSPVFCSTWEGVEGHLPHCTEAVSKCPHYYVMGQRPKNQDKKMTLSSYNNSFYDLEAFVKLSIYISKETFSL